MATERIAGVDALFAPTNKNGSSGVTADNAEGVVSPYFPELELDMDDVQLLQMADDWTKAWNAGKNELAWRQNEVEKYWLGVTPNDLPTADAGKQKPKADNLIYESLETFLPKATQKNPEPVVRADGTTLGNQVARTTEKMLTSIAENKDVDLRMTLRQVARFHQLYFLGCVKIGWSMTTKNVTVTAVRPQKLILDPNSTVENGNYTGKYVGFHCEETASELSERFPDCKEHLTEVAQGKMATKLQFVEWWSDGETPAVFWTMGRYVLGKMRNPHFNYPSMETQVDEFGAETQQEVGGRNYFDRPRMPFELLSITNLGQRPYDLTNGLFQCLSMQDVVTKRWKQIDRNADNTNNGIIASLDYFEEGQAAQAAQALRAGDVMLQPKGIAGEGIKRDTGTPLPTFIYDNLLDARQRILSVYGVSGSVPSGLQKDRTVRGKMITRSADDDRIGGGFTEYLEKMAAKVYEQFVQFMYVYYDEPKYASVVGKEKAMEYIQLSAGELANVQLAVDVREGSMIPKDSLTKRQEAIDLWGANGIDPISFYEALDFPNPRESARMLFLWQQNPAALFPELGQPAAQPPPPTGTPPPEPEGGQALSTAIPLTPLPT
jgi:hypothetical protein